MADSKRWVNDMLRLDAVRFESNDTSRRRATVSARELSIPARARQEYEEAQKRLSRPDVDGAVGHLQRAVEIAPQFSAAWNRLGTIAYPIRTCVDRDAFAIAFENALQNTGSSRPACGWSGSAYHLRMPVSSSE
jgi:hypothetical protein